MGLISILGACLSFTALAPETILIKKDLQELCHEAEFVFEGEVREVSAAWNADRTLIWTESRLAVSTVLFGPPLSEVALREPGGIVLDIGQQVEGMARYQRGERVLVFAKRDALGQWRTTGCIQGRFLVEADIVHLDPGLSHVHAAHFKAPEKGLLREVSHEIFVAKLTSLIAARPK